MLFSILWAIPALRCLLAQSPDGEEPGQSKGEHFCCLSVHYHETEKLASNENVWEK